MPVVSLSKFSFLNDSVDPGKVGDSTCELDDMSSSVFRSSTTDTEGAKLLDRFRSANTGRRNDN